MGNHYARTMLFSALLNEIGINNEFLLTIPKQLPIISDHFKGVICKVKATNKPLYLDFQPPTTRFPTINPQLQECPLLNLTTQKLEKIDKLSSQFSSEYHSTLEITFTEKQTVKTTASITANGVIEANIRQELQDKAISLSQWFAMKNKISTTMITTIYQSNHYNYSKPLQFKGSYTCEHQSIKSSKEIILFIPELEYLSLTPPSVTTFEIKITPPSDYLLLPANEINIDNGEKEIFHKTINPTPNGATLNIKLDTKNITKKQKAMIKNELKKAIVFQVTKQSPETNRIEEKMTPHKKN
jgi:hypothetical protein